MLVKENNRLCIFVAKMGNADRKSFVLKKVKAKYIWQDIFAKFNSTMTLRVSEGDFEKGHTTANEEAKHGGGG
ncbi:hypothetical protein CUMW_177150 [Citrus unshiu]|uniref:Uncharacterized protein n=1 Tax=Citrus unshiu TaxID=55188 RepID=A0A2H5PXR9_CITUN|nr:hypothetical protein CUMW_177150 [Citrus unshiu]